MSQQPEFQDRSWVAVQPELRPRWETLHPDLEWDTIADTIRDAWEHPPAMAGTSDTATTAGTASTTGADVDRETRTQSGT